MHLQKPDKNAADESMFKAKHMSSPVPRAEKNTNDLVNRNADFLVAAWLHMIGDRIAGEINLLPQGEDSRSHVLYLHHAGTCHKFHDLSARLY